MAIQSHTLSLATARGTLAMVDQSIVSATRFLTTILIGRLCGASDLGLFAVIMSLLLLASCTGESLIAKPYTVYSPRFEEHRRRQYAGSVLLHLGVLAAISIGTVVAIGGLLSGFDLVPPRLGRLMILLAAVLPFTLLWDFARRVCFADDKIGTALAIDAGFSVLQLGGLLLLGGLQELTLPRAILVIALASGAVGMAWLWCNRKRFVTQAVQAGSDWKHNWRFAKWIFTGQVSGVLHGYAVTWIITLMINSEAAGHLWACETIFLLSNPLVLGMANWLGPYAARAYASSGVPAVRRITAVASLALLVGMGLFLLGLILFAEPLLTLFYGSSFAGNGLLVILFAVGGVFTGISLATTSGLAAMEDSKVIFTSSLVGLVTAVVLAVPLIADRGLTGAVLAMLIGDIAVTLVPK